MHAAIALLLRAIAMPRWLRRTSRASSSAELGIALRGAGRPDGAVMSSIEPIELEGRPGNDGSSFVRGMEREYVLLPSNSGANGGRLPGGGCCCDPRFRGGGTRGCLGRAWLLMGWVQGGHRADTLSAGGRRGARWALSPLDMARLAACSARSPTRCTSGRRPSRRPLRDAERSWRPRGSIDIGRANVETHLGGLLAQPVGSIVRQRSCHRRGRPTRSSVRGRRRRRSAARSPVRSSS